MDADRDERAAPIGARRISDFAGAMGALSLVRLTGECLTGERLTGECLPGEATRTPMMERVSRAWATPLDELTCEQLRLLVGQGMGLDRLIGPALAISRLMPRAQVTFYPGDLAHVLLRRAAHALAHEPDGTRAFLGGDFGWIDGLPGRRSRVESADLLAAARLAAGSPDDAKPARSHHGRPPRPPTVPRRAGARVRRRAG